MANTIELKVPDIGDFHGVPVIEVLVKAGDRVEKDQSLVTLESAKATMEVPASSAGIIKEVKVKVGDNVEQGAVIAVVEAGLIAWLMATRPALNAAVVIESPLAGDTVLLDGKPVGTTPLKLTVTPNVRAIRLVSAAADPRTTTPAATVKPPVVRTANAPTDARVPPAPIAERSGVRIAAPIDLTVVEGTNVLGSTASGPIFVTPGVHQFDLLNTGLGYRVHQTVTIRPGAVIPLTITPPMGQISVNAEPWAQVTIDDQPIGDTPLANVSVTLPATVAPFVLPMLRVADVVTIPITAAGRVLVRLFARGPVAATPAERDPIQDLLREGELEGVGEREEIAIISGVVEFSEKIVREVMTPRSDVFALPEGVDPHTLASQIAQSRYSRVPIYRGTLDSIIGMVHAFDVIKAHGDVPDTLRPVAFSAPEAPCNELLFRMLRERLHLAIVQDGGRTVGLVTLEDLLEELVGDIRDEHDAPDPPRAGNPGTTGTSA